MPENEDQERMGTTEEGLVPAGSNPPSTVPAETVDHEAIAAAVALGVSQALEQALHRRPEEVGGLVMDPSPSYVPKGTLGYVLPKWGFWRFALFCWGSAVLVVAMLATLLLLGAEIGGQLVTPVSGAVGVVVGIVLRTLFGRADGDDEPQ